MITKVTNDLYQVAIPVPLPLKLVNCYLARGADGWDLLDTGMVDPGSITAWQQTFKELQLRPADIRRIYISHIHADHLGLARWFVEQSGATVYLLDRERDHLKLWADLEPMARECSALYAQHGMPPEVVRGVIGALRQLNAVSKPPDTFAVLSDGDMIEFGRHTYQVIWTPGHSDGMFCLYSADEELLFAADHVLPRISPNISLWPGARPDPLADYLASLTNVQHLPVRRVLPGHGAILTDLHGRVGELLAHHEQRLDVMLDAAADGRTTYDVTRKVFRINLSQYEVQFAMTETLAHLEYLTGQGALRRISQDHQLLYHAA